MSRAQKLRKNAFKKSCKKSYFKEKIKKQKKITSKQDLVTIVGKTSIDKIAKKYYNWTLTLLEAAAYSNVRLRQDVKVTFRSFPIVHMIGINVSPILDDEIFYKYLDAFGFDLGPVSLIKEEFVIDAFYAMKAMFDNEEGYSVDIFTVNTDNLPGDTTPNLNTILNIHYVWQVNITMHYIK